jgi:membrane protease YdiL (CAAX protease family)
MQNELILAFGHCGVISALGLVGAILFRKSFHPGWFVAALLIYILYDFLLTRGFYQIPNPIEGAHWNWFGKALSFAGMLIVAAILGFRRVGFTLRQAPGSWPAFALFAALAAYFFYSAITGADGKPDDLETIAFQWTMPGLDEELFFTGVFLFAMNEAFKSRVNVFGAPIGYGALLVAVLFGLVHAMDYDAGKFSFEAMTFASVVWGSPILLWMRARTGSLLLPILAHNIANGASTLF